MKRRGGRNIRVVVAKLGLDGHDRGAKVISRFLRDAGMDVVYTGIRQTPEAVCNAALQEDADIIGISILSGAHNSLVPRLLNALQERGMKAPVVVGGIIPERDAETLKQAGVAEVFTPGASAREIARKMADIAHRTRLGKAE